MEPTDTYDLEYAVAHYESFCADGGYELPGHGPLCEEASSIVKSGDAEESEIDVEDFTLFVNQRPADGQAEPGEDRDLLDFRTLDRGASYTAELDKPALFVAGDASQVGRFADWLDDEMAAQVRGVDFDRVWVIAVFRGLASSSGYEIETRFVRATEEAVELTVDLKDPAPDQMVAQVITYPYHIVVVPREVLQPVSETIFSVHTGDGKLLVQVEYP